MPPRTEERLPVDPAFEEVARLFGHYIDMINKHAATRTTVKSRFQSWIKLARKDGWTQDDVRNRPKKDAHAFVSNTPLAQSTKGDMQDGGLRGQCGPTERMN